MAHLFGFWIYDFLNSGLHLENILLPWKTLMVRFTMESLQLSNLLNKHDHDQAAVIHISAYEIIEKINFATIFNLAHKIKKFILKNVKTNVTLCIGLLMEKNIYIPSLIISLQDLDYAFMFLSSPNNLKENNIQWVLSIDVEPTDGSCLIKDNLILSKEKQMQLWLNKEYKEDGTSKLYKGIFCVVHTSGSTGESKTIYVPGECIERNVHSLNKHFNVSKNDVLYWGTPLTFDPTLVECLLGLLNGATLVVVSKSIMLNPPMLLKALFNISSVTFMQVVPSIFLRWSKQQIEQILLNKSLKVLAFGGEVFPQDILKCPRHKDLKIFNLYGVTELSCWATIFDINASGVFDENDVPLGEVLDDTFVEIRKEKDDDEVGEIFIGSSTRFCFINNLHDKPQTPFVVATGDLGRYHNNRLLYRGRKTRLIKRFGHKISLEHIEKTIWREMGLQSRLVYCIDDKKLLAFVVIEEQFDERTKGKLLDKIRVKLLNVLPEQGFPDFIDVLSCLPLNSHGKICDSLLKKRYQHQNAKRVPKEDCKNLFEATLSNYLKIDLQKDRTFNELGGSSLLAMQMLRDFEEKIGNYHVPGQLVILLLNESIQKCLDYVESYVFIRKRVLEEEVENNENRKVLKSEMGKTNNCVLWKYNLRGCVDAPPLAFVKRNQIYAACGSFAHRFSIINPDGSEYLSLILPQEIEAQPSLSECTNFIFIGCTDGTLFCIDFEHKTFHWRYQVSGKITCAPLVCGSSVIVGSYDASISSLSIKDGCLQWRTDVEGAIKADCVYDDRLKRVFVATLKGICYVIGDENGKVLWRCKLEGPIFGAAGLVENGCTIWCCVTGNLYYIDTNGQILWTHKVSGNIFSSIKCYNNEAYFGCQDKHLYKLVLSETSDCKLYQLVELESETTSSPFLHHHQGKLYLIAVCNVGVLYVIDLSIKTVVFRWKLPAQSFSSPYMLENKVFVGCRDDHLYCIDIASVI